MASVSDMDIAALVSELDTEDMLGHLRNFPDDFANQMEIPEESGRTSGSLLCLGMGGSAAAGDFLAGLADAFGAVQVKTWRNYFVRGLKVTTLTPEIRNTSLSKKSF